MSNFQCGYIKVGLLHEIYYECHGNKSGSVFLFLHGGPGGSFSNEDLQFFDLNKCRVILFDQRGCGRSKPLGEIKENTTQELISDIKSLLDLLGIEQVVLFGGSWGSTLGLLFTLKYPDIVKGMILRGLFTATKSERIFLEQGESKSFHPIAWNRFKSTIPDCDEKEVFDQLCKRILESTEAEQYRLCYEMAFYGLSLSFLDAKDEKEVEKMLKGKDLIHEEIIFAHYSVYDFFIPDGYIYTQLDKLEEIPIHIIQGKYDMITTPEAAIVFSDKLSNVHLQLIIGGHYPREGEMFKALSEVVSEFY